MLSQSEISTCCVLFVDDDEYVIKALVRMLRPYCDRILTALTGEEALAILATQKVDVIISDSLMPPVTGMKLIRAAKAMCPAIVPIVLSGKSDLADIQRAKRDGVLHTFMRKPWDDRELIHVIHEAFASSLESR